MIVIMQLRTIKAKKKQHRYKNANSHYKKDIYQKLTLVCLNWFLSLASRKRKSVFLLHGIGTCNVKTVNE